MKVACWESSSEAKVSYAKRGEQARPYMVKVILPEPQSAGLTVIPCGKETVTTGDPIFSKVFKLRIKSVGSGYPQRGDKRRTGNLNTDTPRTQ